MANTIKIGNIDISSFKVGSSDCSIYLGTTLLYSGGTTPPTPPTPTGCYEVIPDSITAYTSTTYDSVYSWSDEKWYMKNNLDQYEEYGVYDTTGSSLSDYTYYDGKLVAIGTTEYQRSGDTWVEVGTYEDASVTYTIDDTDPSPYVGQTLPTTFKIPKEEMDNVGNFSIYDTNSGMLNINTFSYRYRGDEMYDGTVNLEGDYYYFTMSDMLEIEIDSIDYSNPNPLHLTCSEALTITEEDEYEYSGVIITTTFIIPQTEMDDVRHFTINDTNGGELNVNTLSYEYYGDDEYEGTVNQEGDWYKYEMLDMGEIEINRIDYMNPNPLHLIYFPSGEISVEYAPKVMPLGKVYQSSSAMQADTCPSIGVGQNGVVSDNAYVFTSNGTWSTVSNFKFIGTYDNVANVITCNSSSALTSGETQPSYIKSSMTSAVLGQCVTSIGEYAFWTCRSLQSITIPNSVTSIGEYAFSSCQSLSSITIPSSVTTIGDGVFYWCASLTSITIPNSVTTISDRAFEFCASLTSITIPNSVTSIGKYAFGDCKSLTSITIPSSVTTIGDGVFSFCESLQGVTCLATTPPTLGTKVFNSTNNYPIYVPSESVSAYQTASNWSTYASRIQAIPNS